MLQNDQIDLILNIRNLTYFKSVLLIISILMMLLTSIQFFFNYKINSSSVYLSFFLFLISIYGLLHYFTILSQSIIGIAIIYGHFMPLFYLIGPLLLFYIKSTLNDKKYTLGPKDLIHFLPFLIGLISILPYYFAPFQIKTEIAQKIINHISFHKHLEISWLYPNILNTYFRPILILIYAFASLCTIFKFRKNKSLKEAPRNQKYYIIIWLVLISVITLLIAICYSFTTFIFYKLPEFTNVALNHYPLLIIAAILYCFIPITLLIFPGILYGLPRVLNKLNEKVALESTTDIEFLSNKKNLTTKDPFKQIADKIILYINTEKPYLSEDFNIDDIADKLDIPKHHVYYCFSNFFDKKFTKLRTELRVKHAKELLLTDEINISSLEGIWSKSGFSSKTSFFTSFKDETGLTPKEYLQQKRFS